MKFEISGVDQHGKDRTVIVAALDEKVALGKAKAAGISAYSVTKIQEEKPEPTPPPLPLGQTAESDERFSGPYIYKMVQIPPTISVKEGGKNEPTCRPLPPRCRESLRQRSLGVLPSG